MRVMMMVQPGRNSRDVMLDVEAGFRQAGHDVIRWEFEPLWQRMAGASQPRQRAMVAASVGKEVCTRVHSEGIDFTIAMWANGVLTFGLVPGAEGRPATSIFEWAKVRHVLFWLDAPHWAHQGDATQLYRTPIVAEPSLFHVINNEGLAREMREVMGFGQVLARRYGVNPEVFKPWPGLAAAHDIVFNLGAGDPEPTDAIRRELESDDPDLDAIRRASVDEARRRMGAAAAEAGDLGPGVDGLLDAWVASQIERPGTPLLDRLAVVAEKDPGLAAPLEAVKRTPTAFVQIAEHARSIERWRRAFTIAYLSRHFNCAAFGAGDLSGWPHQAKLYGPSPYHGMSRVYGLGRIGLNAMRWQDDGGLNIKPFEITASGRACLCDRRGGLADLFEIGTEIAAFGSPGEARRVAAELLASPVKLAAMAEAGRARTLRDHTWARWADDICDFVMGGA
ncbi:MAG: glycosyltransferase family 1 protein [Phycisphaeraceae bacterium]|nr:MAG: glycosyltransferase family 1 protein [Phycisphaeraceae bacterium]